MCKLIWLKSFIWELGFLHDDHISILCDNQTAIDIASNPVFYERTKSIEVDCHFIREVVKPK